MSRLIFVPQFPAPLRYQEFFYSDFPIQFKKYFTEVITLGEKFVNTRKESIRESKKDSGLFSSIKLATQMEFFQTMEYLDLEISNDDYLLCMDLSYPGFFSNILYHKPMKNSFCYCHATSVNNGDIFEKVRASKYPNEVAHSKLYKKVFLGSNYHKKKLLWGNTEVVGLPVPSYKRFSEQKIYDIISVVRPNPQKITKEVEDRVEKEFGQIIRKEVKTWKDYYKFLSSGKVLLITTKEETFGYSAMEAIMNGTIVIAPNDFSYPELLPQEFLYDNYDDLRDTIEKALSGELMAPSRLLCQNLCDNFYENISDIMLKG